MPEEQKESIFGPPADPEYQKEQFPFLFDESDEEQGTAAPEIEAETPTETVAPVVETPAPVAAEETQEEQVADGTEETEEEVLYANKYRTVDDLVKGYNNSRAQYNRAEQRARAFEEQSVTAQRQLQMAQRQLQDAALYIQQMQYMAQQRPAQPAQDAYGNDIPQQPQQVGVDPELIPLLQQQALLEEQERLRGEVGAELEARREAQDRNDAIMGFFENHPEVEVNSPADVEVRRVLREWEDAWGEYEPVVSNPATLEIAYEASQNPELRTVLAMHPQYIDSEEGLELARMRANELKAGRAVTQSVSQVPAQTVGQRKPHVERASTGNPKAGSEQKPLDPWEEAVLAYREENDQAKGLW